MIKPTRWIARHLWLIGTLAALVAMGTNARADPLHDAAENCDAVAAQKLVRGGASLEARKGKGESALMLAALNRCTDVAALLVEKGADVKAWNDARLSALHAAAYGGDPTIIELLLQNGAEINDQQNKFKATPLHMAAEEDHKAAVLMLIKHGADITATEVNGFTPLTRASFRLHKDMLTILFDHGAKCQKMTLHFVAIGARKDAFGDWLTQRCNS